MRDKNAQMQQPYLIIFNIMEKQKKLVDSLDNLNKGGNNE